MHRRSILSSLCNELAVLRPARGGGLMFKDKSWVVIANYVYLSILTRVMNLNMDRQAFCYKRYASPLEVVYALPCRQKQWQDTFPRPRES